MCLKLLALDLAPLPLCPKFPSTGRNISTAYQTACWHYRIIATGDHPAAELWPRCPWDSLAAATGHYWRCGCWQVYQRHCCWESRPHTLPPPPHTHTHTHTPFLTLGTHTQRGLFGSCMCVSVCLSMTILVLQTTTPSLFRIVLFCLCVLDKDSTWIGI